MNLKIDAKIMSHSKHKPNYVLISMHMRAWATFKTHIHTCSQCPATRNRLPPTHTHRHTHRETHTNAWQVAAQAPWSGINMGDVAPSFSAILSALA